MACLHFCSYTGLPVSLDRVPNSSSIVPAQAVHVKRVSLGSMPYTVIMPHVSIGAIVRSMSCYVISEVH